MWVDQITTMQEFPRSELSFMSDVGIILTGGENDLLNATPEENDKPTGGCENQPNCVVGNEAIDRPTKEQ
ncbi:unnamed protein product [Brassica oleracea]